MAADDFLSTDYGTNVSKQQAKRFAKDTAISGVKGWAKVDNAFTSGLNKGLNAGANALGTAGSMANSAIRPATNRIKSIRNGMNPYGALDKMERGAMNKVGQAAGMGNTQMGAPRMSPIARKGASTMGKMGKFAGLNVAFAGAFTALDYATDPKADHFGTKMVSNTIGFMGDELMGLGISKGINLAGMAMKGAGMARMGGMAAAMSTPVGIAATIAVHAVGAGVSTLLGAHHDKTMGQMDAVRRGGKRNIEQNKRTMQATQQGMSLLGQAGNYSMLGNEAQMMHT